MALESDSYLIIGAGIFGASTALHLSLAKPHAIVTLLDRVPFPNPSAASHDLNKIIRTDYSDIFYMKLALEAVEHWRTNPIFKEYYHESGMAWTEQGTGRAAISNFKKLGVQVDAEIFPLENARARFGGLYKDAKLDGAEEIYWNPRSGWGEAEGALRSIINAAIVAGVVYHEATVSTLILNDSGTCTGVNIIGGGSLSARHVILCTGAMTAKLLADTAPHNKEIQVGDRLIAAGACSGTAMFAPEMMDRLKNAPVFINDSQDDGHGESIPITADGRLKFNCEDSFTNMTYHNASQQSISIPPTEIHQSTWSQNVPQGLKDDIQKVIWNSYGKNIPGLQILSYRICWDAITPDQDFLISNHPHCKQLYIATGGSFHSWKFMPNIGKYVMQLLDGTLDEEKTERWAWNRQNSGTACEPYIPARDLKNIAGYIVMRGE